MKAIARPWWDRKAWRGYEAVTAQGDVLGRWQVVGPREVRVGHMAALNAAKEAAERFNAGGAGRERRMREMER